MDDQDSDLDVLAVLCGTRNAETVTSSGQGLTVELATDASRQRQGFAATFRFVDEAAVTPPPADPRRRPPASTTTPATGDPGGLGGWSSLTSHTDGHIHAPGTTVS